MDPLKLENQLCFPLYVCAKEIVRLYTPYLAPYDLTYTQYLTLLVLWEHPSLEVKELGKYLYLDSGTLTPLLKKMEQKGYLIKTRKEDDERALTLTLTEKALKLKEELYSLPSHIRCALPLENEELITLYKLLYKILNNLETPKQAV